MSLDITRIDVPEGIMEFGGLLQEPMDDILEAAAHYMADAYRGFIVMEGAVDSGDFLASVQVFPEHGFITINNERSKQVIADVGYSQVVEYGWINRGHGQASYPGRYPAKQAITFYIDQLVAGQVRDTLAWRLGRQI